MTNVQAMRLPPATPSVSLISEVEDALQSGSVAKRTDALRRITDLFLAGADQFSVEHTQLFDDVMTKAVTYLEGQVLAELGSRLATTPRAPSGIIRRLAQDDDITIAGPVLEQSEQLTDDDLAEIASTKGQGHLLKISSRSALGTAVTDVLVERGDATIRRTVAANKGAQFSEISFSKLVIHAEQDEELLAAVGERADLPPLLLRHVLARATDTVRERLMTQSSSAHRSEIQKTLKEVSRRATEKISPRRYAEAESRLASITQDTALTKAKLREFVRERRLPESIVALAALCGLPVDLADHLVNNSGCFGAMTLCRAIDLDWTITTGVLRVRLAPEDASEQDFADLSEQYREMSVSAAQRILRFWQTRQN